MTNAIATLPISKTLSSRQLDLVKRTIAKDCNTSEFDLFIEIARNKGLDPFSKQIIPLVFSKDNAAKRNMTILFPIDGLRVMASRCGDYRPDDERPDFETDASLKDANNPAGLVSVSVKAFKQDSRGEWHKVTGVAYWEEFAPVTEEWAYDEAAGRRKPTGKMALDTKGQWGKMPRIMLAKCAEAQALRRGWPEAVGGLYEPSEMDQARTREDLSASESIEKMESTQRLARIGGRAVSFLFDPQGELEGVAIGSLHDRLAEYVRTSPGADRLKWFIAANKTSLQQFWSDDPAAALDIKTMIETAIEEASQEASA